MQGGADPYSTWVCMMGRCFNKSHPEYARYGGWGITVCPEWFDFENFFAEVGERPEGTTLDRWPNDSGNYYPETAGGQRPSSKPRTFVVWVNIQKRSLSPNTRSCSLL